jgi:hypothetical protein
MTFVPPSFTKSGCWRFIWVAMFEKVRRQHGQLPALARFFKRLVSASALAALACRAVAVAHASARSCSNRAASCFRRSRSRRNCSRSLVSFDHPHAWPLGQCRYPPSARACPFMISGTVETQPHVRHSQTTYRVPRIKIISSAIPISPHRILRLAAQPITDEGLEIVDLVRGSSLRLTSIFRSNFNIRVCRVSHTVHDAFFGPLLRCSTRASWTTSVLPAASRLYR